MPPNWKGAGDEQETPMPVRLPTYRDLGGLPSGRSGAVIASYDVSAIGRGQIAMAESIMRAMDDLARLGQRDAVTSSASVSMTPSRLPAEQEAAPFKLETREYIRKPRPVPEPAKQSSEETPEVNKKYLNTRVQEYLAEKAKQRTREEWLLEQKLFADMKKRYEARR